MNSIYNIPLICIEGVRERLESVNIERVEYRRVRKRRLRKEEQKEKLQNRVDI